MFGLNLKITRLKLIFCIIIVFQILVCSSIIILENSDTNDYIDSTKPIDENPNMRMVQNEHEQKYSTPHSTRAPLIDLELRGNRSNEFNKDRVFKSVTVRDEATLIIKDCEVWINGTLKVNGSGRLFIMNSTVHIAPGPMDMYDIVVNFSNNAYVKISDSNLFTHAQPTPTNISYLLSDDNSEITIIRSYMNIKLPKIVYMDIEITPPTAGTFILTGETIWNIQNCTIESYLYYNEEEMLAGRWFVFTLQRKSKLYMKDSVGSLENSDTNPFIKPVAGYVKIENCNIRKGVIDNEVVGEIDVVNLTISNLNLRDQTKSRVVRSEIINTVDLGGVAIYSPTAVVGTEKPKATLHMEDTVIGPYTDSDGIFFAIGNSTSNIIGSKFKKGIIQSEAKIILNKCSVDQFIEGNDKGSLTLENSSVPKVFLDENCKLAVYSSLDNKPIDTVTTKFNSRSEITAHTAKITTLEVWPGDNIKPENYDAFYEPDRNVSKISVHMVNSSLEQLRATDDAEISFTLQNSQINDLAFDTFKNEQVIITILDLGSTYNIPDPWPDVDLEINIYHRVQLKSMVNDKAVKSYISVKNDKNEDILKSYTNENGMLDVELFSKKFTASGTLAAGEYSISASYLGFSKQLKVESKVDEELVIAWEDYNTPTISNIKVDTSYQTTERGTFIQASIDDTDAKVVANATIFYQTRKKDQWSEWKGAAMIEIDDNLYEGSIPQVEPGSAVRFYIEAYDILGNKEESEKHSYEIEDTQTTSALALGLVILVIIFLILLFVFRRRAKVKKYLNKSKSNL